MTCSIDACSRKGVARGWCARHYNRWKTKGDVHAEVAFRATNIQEAFEHYTHPEGECLVWVGNTRMGYGRVRYKKVYSSAHRVAYELAHGPIPEGMQVDHTCFNRPCVKVDHLRLATHKQNQEHSSGAMSNSKSGIRGVYWSDARNKWVGEVGHNKKIVSAGGFATKEEAQDAVVALRNRLHTHNNKDR